MNLSSIFSAAIAAAAGLGSVLGQISRIHAPPFNANDDWKARQKFSAAAKGRKTRAARLARWEEGCIEMNRQAADRRARRKMRKATARFPFTFPDTARGLSAVQPLREDPPVFLQDQ